MKEERLTIIMENTNRIKTHGRTVDMILIAMFTTLITVGAFIKIPVPVVPFTLQVTFTTLAGYLLGSKRGALSVCLYIALGLMGVPVFTEGGGFWYVLKPSFGYIIGFAVGTYVTGLIVERAKKVTMSNLLIAGFAGLAIVYAFGMVYVYVICNYVINAPISVWSVIVTCFLIVVPGDIILTILSAILCKRLIPVLKNQIG